MDAVLVIGNEAMVQPKEPVPYSYDLGELWFRKTGFPVVFAVFAVQKDFADKNRECLDTLVSSFRASISMLSQDRNSVIKAASARYPDVIYDIDNYYKTLQFGFSDDLKQALRFYFEQAEELGLIEKAPMLSFI